MKDIIKLLRPHQYVKNIFIFAPLIFSFQFQMENIISATLTFIIFSLLASSVYIINDYMDIEEDRKHPTKKLRPLVSGSVSKSKAKFLILTP